MDSFVLSEITQEQVRLSDIYILPNLHKLENALLLIRNRLDEVWNDENIVFSSSDFALLKLIQERKQKTQSNIIKLHPLGGCLHISRIIYKYIINYDFKQPEPQFDFLKEFYSARGVFKPISGQVKNQYFQNAWQIGNFYVDVANDTVVLEKPKVEIHSFLSADCPFKEITDLATYVSVKEKYHQCQVFKQDVIAEIQKKYPLVWQINKRMAIDTNPIIPYLWAKNMCNKNDLTDVPELSVQQQEKLVLAVKKLVASKPELTENLDSEKAVLLLNQIVRLI